MKVGIIGAMDEEIEILKETIQQRSEKPIGGGDFCSGKIADTDVVLLKSGIGKVNAAIATTLLIERYASDIVINTGSAGGFHQALSVGDIVISSEVRYHDVDVTVFDYEYGQVPQMPPAYRADAKLIDIAERAAQQIDDVQSMKGLIASGDSFMSDPERVAFIREKFPQLLAAEMEACAIAQTCHRFDVPFVMIRALSDIAGKDSRISFEEFLKVASKHSANLIQLMLKELNAHA